MSDTITIVIVCMSASYLIGSYMASRALRKREKEWELRCGRPIDSRIMDK